MNIKDIPRCETHAHSHYSNIRLLWLDKSSKGFDSNGLGGIVNASRSLMAAYKSDLWKGKEYKEATRLEAIRMRDEIVSAINS